ncbi:hypothetical protein OAG77_01220 [bacterium]|nr:hypothetical protein [bacterium]
MLLYEVLPGPGVRCSNLIEMKCWVMSGEQNVWCGIGTGFGLLVCLLLGASCSEKVADVDVPQAPQDAPNSSEVVEAANGLSSKEIVSDPIEESIVDPRGARLLALESKLQSTLPRTWKGELDRFFRNLSAKDRRDLLNDLAVSLASQSAASARTLVLALTDTAERQTFATKVGLQILEKDTVAAREWVEGFEDTVLRHGTAGSLARSWSRRDAKGVVDWFESISDEKLQEPVLDGLIWGWAQADRTEAYEWVQKLENRTVQDAALLKLTKMVALKDPESAAAWVLAFPESAARMDGLRFALHRWSGKALTDAMQWVSELEDPSLFREGTLTIARIWTMEEPRAVTKWAGDLPETMRDDAFKVVADEWGKTEPEAVIGWAKGLEDEALKNGLLRRVAFAWKQRDGDGFTAWRENLNDPALKAFLGD